MAILLVLVIAIALVFAGYTFLGFVSRSIYQESVAHLTEIFHQANQSLYSVVSSNWSRLRMWSPYLETANSEAEIQDYLNKAKEETKFTDFYFISRNGDYLSLEGETGYLDLRNQLSDLILKGEPVAINSVVPDKPEIMVFAVPAERNEYDGFEYEAIAVTFNNSDLVKALKISAFDGQASTFAVLPDGRVVVDNGSQDMEIIRNLLAWLDDADSIAGKTVDDVQADFVKGKSGSIEVVYDGISCYLIYEPASFQNWMVVGIAPTSVVNSTMNRLQTITMVVVSGIIVVLAVTVFLAFFWQTRQKLKYMDTALLSREELFSKLSANVDDIFIMLNAKSFQVEYVSPNVEKLLGFSEEQVHQNVRILHQAETDTELATSAGQLAELKPGMQLEWDREYVHRQSGEVHLFHVIAFCSDIQGEMKYILDLSDRTKDRQMNQALRDAVQTAENASRAKSSFLSSMSHDIRTPMNAIIGFATLAVANVTHVDKVKDYLAKILSSGNHLLSLINDVLDMSRIESGKIRLEEQEVNLSDVFHDIKTIIGGQVHAKQLDLYMDVLDVTDENVYCDKTRLNQALLNLLSNAIKFTPPGGTVSVRVSQLARTPDGKGSFEIRVKDTGVGMSPEFADRVFEPFEREHTSTVSKIQGTGLGMAITKNIVDMMGGTIDVFTEQGKGTEFVIRLSLRLQSGSRRTEKIAELEGLKALVVDDNFDTCDSVTKMLVAVGMRSEWTLSGKEAVLRAKQSLEIQDPFSAYIIDWRLPDMNGIEVTRRIRELGDDTPIIILTAYDWTDIEDEARAAGVTAFCSKPMFMSDLRETLMTALGRRSAKNDGVLPVVPDESEFRCKRLLLVEDNELNREIAIELLSEYGFVVDMAENGKQAVEKIAGSKPGDFDLVLMDVQMPIMDGYEATRRIRELEDPALASIPILAMTANAFDEDRRAALACGMNGFLSKPIDIKKVVETLRKMLNPES